MRIHCLEHVPFEGLGRIADWCGRKQYSLKRTKFFADGTLPKHDDYDALIVMGGPMGAYDEEMFPWLVEEKSFLREAVDDGKLILGVCLGAQLLAEVIGGRVFPGAVKEIGWFPVEGNSGQSFFPSHFEPLHWHGDTFELPDDADVLVSNRCYQNQAFLFREHVVGLQFHLELTPADVRSLSANSSGESPKGPFVQSTEAILSETEKFAAANALLQGVLERWEGLRA